MISLLTHSRDVIAQSHNLLPQFLDLGLESFAPQCQCIDCFIFIHLLIVNDSRRGSWTSPNCKLSGSVDVLLLECTDQAHYLDAMPHSGNSNISKIHSSKIAEHIGLNGMLVEKVTID